MSKCGGWNCPKTSSFKELKFIICIHFLAWQKPFWMCKFTDRKPSACVANSASFWQGTDGSSRPPKSGCAVRSLLKPLVRKISNVQVSWNCFLLNVHLHCTLPRTFYLTCFNLTDIYLLVYLSIINQLNNMITVFNSPIWSQGKISIRHTSEKSVFQKTYPHIYLLN